MARTVHVNNSTWLCIGAESIAGGCAAQGVAGCSPRTICPANARAADLRRHDYLNKPPPRFGHPGDGLMPHMVGLSYAELEKVFRDELRNMGAGAIGAQMVNRFMTGGGQYVLHRPGSPLVQQASSTSSFQSGKRKILECLQKKVAPQFGAGRQSYDFELPEVPWIEWSTLWHILPGSSTKALGAAVGGTKGIKVFARNLYERPDRTLRLDLRIEICDHFGVDETDAYSVGLCAFWLLQHARPGSQRPFVNLLVLEETTTIRC
jgi:hypothetical protein